MRTISRRKFINIGGLSLAGAAVGSSLFNLACEKSTNLGGRPIPELTGYTGNDSVKVPTICEICFWQCAGWVHTVNGQPWKITGNEIDPNCNGRFCPRGTGGIGAYLDNDRLKNPLIRTSDRGKQSFKEVSWDEALNYIAEKMQDLKKTYGPECTALFTHGSGGVFFKHLLKAYGSGNIAAPSYAQCRGPREEAFYLTYSEGIGSPERTDIRDTDCLVLIGSHLGENMHNTQVQEFADAVSKGASIITVDPRFSTAAGKSKYWLPIRPATDMALLLAWINVILEEKLYDIDYVGKYTSGLDKLKKSVKNNTPEWAYPITAIEPSLIRDTAREMASHKPSTIVHPGRHVTWYGDDTQRSRAIAILNALLGSWGRRGGFYYPNAAEVPGYPYPPYPKPEKSWSDAFPGLYPLAGTALANGICDATIPGVRGETEGCNFKGWIVYGTNLIHTLPDVKKTIEAIQNLELLVAIDLMPAEITGWADVVLPECSYLERYDDLRIAQGRESSVALRAPAFEPRFNSKPGWWIARELGLKLGLEQYFPWENVEEYLETRLTGIGSSLEDMRNKGVIKTDENFPIYFEDGIEPEFDTPSGKIELYSNTLAELGFDPIPKYVHHEQPQEGYYRLLYGRAPMHTFGRTSNNPVLTDLMVDNEVWINASIARAWDINNGEYVILINQDGVRSNKVRAKVTQKIRHDSVYMVHGFGHTDKRLRKAYKRGADDNALITKVMVDPIMGGTGMRGNFVTFEKIENLI